MPSPEDRRAIQTEVIAVVDGPLRDELAAFLDALTEERRFFVTTVEEVVGSELLIVARAGGELVGLTGITRRFVHLPFAYYVVRRERQGAGVARALYHAKRPFLREYVCVFGTVFSDNRRTLDWLRRRDEVVFHDDGEYAWVASSQRPHVAELIGGVLKLVLPPALAAYRGFRRLRGGR